MIEIIISDKMFTDDSDQTSKEEITHQQAKYEEIISMLLSAGYFRARIPALSAFDKVKSRFF